jgi:hypothetical protein
MKCAAIIAALSCLAHAYAFVPAVSSVAAVAACRSAHKVGALAIYIDVHILNHAEARNLPAPVLFALQTTALRMADDMSDPRIKNTPKHRERPTEYRGACFVCKDNIDTDQIIPAEYLTLVPTKVSIAQPTFTPQFPCTQLGSALA